MSKKKDFECPENKNEYDNNCYDCYYVNECLMKTEHHF